MKIALGFITYETVTAKYLPYFLTSLTAALSACPQDDFFILVRDNSAVKDNDNYRTATGFLASKKWLFSWDWSGENVGFAKSYNKMIKEANAWGADAFFMINPDTLIEPTTIALLSAALTAESCLGSVAPKIRRWDFATLAKTDQIDTCGLTVGSELNFSDIGQGATDQGQFDQTKILGPSGAAGLYRLTALNKIKDPNGYLDERMFMYKEDCDLAYRLYLAGFASRLVPEALVYHDRTASAAGSGILGSLKSRAGKSRSVRSWSFLNQHLLFIKFWAQQKPASKVRILLKVIILWLFALIREPFLLKNYVKIREYLTAAKKTGSTID